MYVTTGVTVLDALVPSVVMVGGKELVHPDKRLLCSQISRAVVQLLNDLKFRIFSTATSFRENAWPLGLTSIVFNAFNPSSDQLHNFLRAVYSFGPMRDNFAILSTTRLGLLELSGPWN